MTLMIAGLVVLFIAAAVPSAYGLRWSYCRHYGEKIGFPLCGSFRRQEFHWSDADPRDRERFLKFGDLISKLYPPESDSWNGLTDDKKDTDLSRIFSEHCENSAYINLLLGRPSELKPGSRVHSLTYFAKSISLGATSVSDDGKLVAEFSWYDDYQGGVGFYLIDESGEKIELAEFQYQQERYWDMEYSFENVLYRLTVRMPDDHYSLHRRHANPEEFIEAGLTALELLEEEIKAYLKTDHPNSNATVKIDDVDIMKCTCKRVECPSNRKLSPDEKAIISADATSELQRRRSLLREHGEIWFETLQKIRIDLE